MNIDVRMIESNETAEIFITVTPTINLSIKEQVEEVFYNIRNVLKETKESIFEERIFSTEDVIQTITLIRKNIYADLDDGIDPTCLIVSKGMYGKFSGVQVHGVYNRKKPIILYSGGNACGRVISQGNKKYISILGISGIEAGKEPTKQAQMMFEKAEYLLQQTGGNMFSIVRTWIWLKDILQWYKDFNNVRTRFYEERGLIKGTTGLHIPTSTGIGIAPAKGAKCALDLFAVVSAEDSIKFFNESGEQSSPFVYGSAFSRAAKSMSPAGETIFVSGTAAVDHRGKTEYVGDVESQIKSTFSHIHAVLRDMNCKEQDIVQMIVYSKTPEVEKVFNIMYSDLSLPYLSVICDICRSELLFEIEVTACLGAQKYYKT
jgi:enamine deaminase RidA (YjgF/YER057c/UK114 family)